MCRHAIQQGRAGGPQLGASLAGARTATSRPLCPSLRNFSGIAPWPLLCVLLFWFCCLPLLILAHKGSAYLGTPCSRTGTNALAIALACNRRPNVAQLAIYAVRKPCAGRPYSRVEPCEGSSQLEASLAGKRVANSRRRCYSLHNFRLRCAQLRSLYCTCFCLAALCCKCHLVHWH